jgi:hypothetical protein
MAVRVGGSAGRRVAEKRGITNIGWVQAPAEELPRAAPGPYRLVPFGTSFHWTDEARLAETVYDMLEAGGALALIVHTVRRHTCSGDRDEDFASDVRELLRSRSPQGVFWDLPGDPEVVLARKPR